MKMQVGRIAVVVGIFNSLPVQEKYHFSKVLHGLAGLSPLNDSLTPW